MAPIESRILVRKSIEDVFSFLNRSESHLNFIPRMTELHQTSQGSFGQAGTTLSGMLNYFGLRIPVDYEIVEVEPNRRLAMKGQMGPILFKDGYVLEKNGEGTEIRFWLDLLPKEWAKIFSPFMGLIGKIHAWETLRNLRRELLKQGIASSRSLH
jgi:Polyketide cyclase / dehydrase and lipid transport